MTNLRKKTKQEEQFEKQLAVNIIMAKEQTGYAFNRLMAQIEKFGAVKACKNTLSKGQFSDGYDRLVDKNLLKLSVEALAVDSKFTSLFTDEEVNFAFEVLCENNFFKGGL